jgi:hypothetical protein
MRSLSCRFDAARHRSLLLLQVPDRWLAWPFLPVVRDDPDGIGTRQFGVVYDARNTSGTMGYSSTVFLHNLFALPLTESRLLAGPKIVYESYDELLDAGWRVD